MGEMRSKFELLPSMYVMMWMKEDEERQTKALVSCVAASLRGTQPHAQELHCERITCARRRRSACAGCCVVYCVPRGL